MKYIFFLSLFFIGSVFAVKEDVRSLDYDYSLHYRLSTRPKVKKFLHNYEWKELDSFEVLLPVTKMPSFESKCLKNHILKKIERQNVILKTFSYLKKLERKNPIEFIDFVNFCRKKLKEKDPEFAKYKKIIALVDEFSLIDDYHNKFINKCLNYFEF
ncbi:hypothetical protein M1446_00225 [Candidatus Dependentiae bacterium]|nr:hypothetical protein [Candidatus Dependentiae bacterium]